MTVEIIKKKFKIIQLFIIVNLVTTILNLYIAIEIKFLNWHTLDGILLILMIIYFSYMFNFCMFYILFIKRLLGKVEIRPKGLFMDVSEND